MTKSLLILTVLLSAHTWGAVPVCTEKVEPLLEEFIATDFGKDRKTVGRDQVDPLLLKAQSFVLGQPDLVVTEMEVTAQTARAPYYKIQGRKKVLDPKSDEINANLAKQRSEFAQGAFIESFKMKKINITFKSQLAGPTFSPLDLNLRFMTPQTQGYKEKVTQLFTENKSLYEKEALKKSVADLEAETNLYHAKFKPFQGFKLVISGYKKCIGAKPALEHQVKTR